MHRSRRFVLITALVALLALFTLAGCTNRYGSTVLRPSDPVVLDRRRAAEARRR